MKGRRTREGDETNINEEGKRRRMISVTNDNDTKGKENKQ